MGGARSLGLGLGVASVAAGAASFAFDAAALGLAAGAAGLAAAVLLQRELGPPPGPDPELTARVQELETAAAAANDRASQAEATLAAALAEAARGPELTPEEVEALVDPVTGLYGAPFFDVTLTSRVAAARRHLRPVAVVLVEVASGVREGQPTAADAALVARQIRATLREADTACYLDDGRFGLVLEDTPENGAVWTVERVRRALNFERKDLTLWAGVACYPAHAFDAGELHTRASAALEAAKEWRQDRIEVATTSDV